MSDDLPAEDIQKPTKYGGFSRRHGYPGVRRFVDKCEQLIVQAISARGDRPASRDYRCAKRHKKRRSYDRSGNGVLLQFYLGDFISFALQFRVLASDLLEQSRQVIMGRVSIEGDNVVVAPSGEIAGMVANRPGCDDYPALRVPRCETLCRRRDL